MSLQIIKKTAVLLILFSLLSACGELDVVLPSTGTYQVKALVNDTSIDDCSLINAGDTIRPYFANPVANDPDITGLIVFLQDSRGEILGGKTLYTLKSDSDTDDETAEDTEESDSQTSDIQTRIPVKRLDRNLPELPLPKNLQMGPYTLVFQVLGKKETLYQTEKPVYYLGEAVFLLKEIQMYLPGASTGPQLVLPGATVLLEARVDFDPQLDPYIVWYNGKKRISEGKLSEGGASFLWETPDQTGFHSLRAEAFPFSSKERIAGSSREIAIPVSSKAVGADIVSGDASNLLHWYQFAGNFQDSKPPVSDAKALVSLDGKPAQWRPIGYSYGLSAGPDNAYMLPPVSFFSDGANEGSGQFLLRFKPAAEGCILSALFTSTASPAEALEMDLSLKGETLSLSLGAVGNSAEQSVEEISAAAISLSDDYITVAINFSIRSNSFEAVLNIDAQDYAKSVSLAAPLNGECSLKLGAPGSIEKETVAAGTTAVWDEIAVLH
jgi:hypothetical protein